MVSAAYVCIYVCMYEHCVCVRAHACMMVSRFHLPNLVANSIIFHIFETLEIRNL